MAHAHHGVRYNSLSRLGQDMWKYPTPQPHLSFCKLKPNLLPCTSIMSARNDQLITLPDANLIALPRRSGNYEPSSWTELLHSLEKTDVVVQDEILSTKIPTLKKSISRMLDAASATVSTELLELVDSIQQLGLGYHFGKEIKAALDQTEINMSKLLGQNDLHTTALLFRLFRANGYEVSQDMFANFVDKEGSFAPCLRCGIKGLLSLYEASFYGFEGEDMLYKATTFTYSNLRQLIELDGQSPWKEKVTHALELPINRRMPRLHTRWFIDIYNDEENMHHELLQLAKLDFSQVQQQHQKDLKELFNWWTKLGLKEKMPYARDRMVELFLFAIGMQPKPQFGYFRLEMSKICILTTIIDDLYDVYGTIEELELFTEALERWDVVYAMERLPDYMKVCFMALFNTVNGLAYEILQEKDMNVVHFLKKMWVDHCKGYLVEAKWFHKNHIPMLSEYLDITKITIGNNLLIAYAYVLLCQNIESKVMETLIESSLIHFSSIVSRLVDDLETTVNEKKRGDVAKAVECYMYHEKVSEVDARDHINNILNKTWQKINKHGFKNPNIPKFLVQAIVNHTRSMHTIYSNGDGIGFPSKMDKDDIISILFEDML